MLELQLLDDDFGLWSDFKTPQNKTIISQKQELELEPLVIQEDSEKTVFNFKKVTYEFELLDLKNFSFTEPTWIKKKTVQTEEETMELINHLESRFSFDEDIVVNHNKKEKENKKNSVKRKKNNVVEENQSNKKKKIKVEEYSPKTSGGMCLRPRKVLGRKKFYDEDEESESYNNKSVSTSTAAVGEVSDPESYSTVTRIGVYTIEERKELIRRFLEKRKRRVWTKRIRYSVRKTFADSRLRVKGRFISKNDESNLREALMMFM